MAERVVLLSVPGLRERDLAHMPVLRGLASQGGAAPLAAHAPAVTCPVQVNMTTGRSPSEHGVVANGFYWRDRDELEMWTAWNTAVECPQVWDLLRGHDASLKTAVWFPLLAKGCGADHVCTPAPIHNPDGSESLWCYTKPEEAYGELMEALGHFPLQHFWGPLAGIQGSAWIVASFLLMFARERPDFSYVYLPHLDYAAQKYGPDSPQAEAACEELDAELGRLVEGVAGTLGGGELLWMVASEYAITPVSQVVYPNRLLRDAGLLQTRPDDTGDELIDRAGSEAWALVDHQHAHLFVRDRDPAVAARVADLMRSVEGIAEVWGPEEQAGHGLLNEHTGDLVLVSEPNSWFAYYYWLDDALAPGFARTVDIHRKPGYDPVELFWDPGLAKEHGSGVPLDASLVRGSHGAPPRTESQRGVILSSERGVLPGAGLVDTDVCSLVLDRFGAR